MAQVDYGNGRLPWHIRRTGFPAAWRLLAAARPHGRRKVSVGVLDSGVDLKHPLLQGYLGRGINLLAPGEPPLDENGHGTHVAGIIALAAGAWTQDLAEPKVELHPVRIFDQAGYGRIGDIVKGLYWCAEQGISLINLSFGTDMKTSRALQRAVREVGAEGILLVGAAGNDGRSGAVDFPGRYGEVLAVSACTRTDRVAPFSSSGAEVDMMAPGAGVISLAPGGGFVRMSGTSMAAPHVTAAAALLLALDSGLSPGAVRKRLTETAEWLPTVSARAQGSGLLRADRALRSLY
ncbi:MAG TPA: S8 family serine peptidase [Symbiobacteriaceae bacterium]|jgi:subtilisin family serine protease|nr:S8 family serine peptidase [Symbiobacteriaceae bacterium]